MRMCFFNLRSLQISIVLLALSAFGVSCAQHIVKEQKLWYDKPAIIWEEALPIGNGKTGAMVFGGVEKERFQLNDNTLWSGGPQEGYNPEAAKLLPILREQIFQKDYAAAQETWRKMQGPYSSRYLTLGDLWLEFENAPEEPKNYKRSLSLDSAITKTIYEHNGIQYTRTAFANHPSDVVVIHLKASEPGALNLRIALDSKLKHTIVAHNNRLELKGEAPYYVAARNYYKQQIAYDEDKDMRFNVQVGLKHQGGTITSEVDKIVVKEADELTLYLTESTNFDGYDVPPGGRGGDAEQRAKETLEKALTKRYKELKSEHVIDYSMLFNRVQFDIQNGRDYTGLPTNERLRDFSEHGDDYDLQTLYYQFGRYLMIAGSRPGSRPMNLQGIWNDHVQPPWGSNYTININTEMNYWPAENTNLSENHEPLFDFIEELADNGSKTAKINYGIEEGWVAHHNSDLWAMTTPVGDFNKDKTYYPQAYAWQMGGAWLSMHLWEHYLYTQDKEFLENRAYALMKGAAQFLMNWLVKDPETGYYVTAPSTSPENHFIYDGKSYAIDKGTAMDLAITRDLFEAVIDASKALKKDKSFRNKVERRLSQIYPYQIGRYGQIQEWFDDVDDPNDKHRHISQLYGLFPGKEIDPIHSPDLAEAAKVTLRHRGDASTGWSMAWKINWWARLREGNHAYSILERAFNYINPADKTIKSEGGGGTYPNLFDAHPPFQIDGNFGATAGMTEMLMQSHNGYIDLLPALPEKWSKGCINGIKARGNFEIDLEWEGHKVKKVEITSVKGATLKIKAPNNLRIKGQSGPLKKDKNGIISIPAKKGETVVLIGDN